MLILLRSGRSRLVRLSIRLVLISKKEKRRHRPAVPPSCAAAHLRQPKDKPAAGKGAGSTILRWYGSTAVLPDASNARRRIGQRAVRRSPAAELSRYDQA